MSSSAGPMLARPRLVLEKSKPTSVKPSSRSAPPACSTGPPKLTGVGTRKVTGRPPASKRPDAKSESIKTPLLKENVAKLSKSETSGRGIPRKLPKQPIQLISEEKDEDVSDMTNYLINRMLSSSDKSCENVENKSYKGLTSDKLAKSEKSKKGAVGKEKIPDNTSETGTYTIEDDVADPEVQKARQNIDSAFGLDIPKDDLVVQPVINDKFVMQDGMKGATDQSCLVIGQENGEEVFEDVGEIETQTHLKYVSTVPKIGG